MHACSLVNGSFYLRSRIGETSRRIAARVLEGSSAELLRFAGGDITTGRETPATVVPAAKLAPLN